MMSDEATPCVPGGDCDQAVADLHAYIDGWADEDRAGELRDHLEGCTSCGEVFSFHERLQELVSKRCKTELPDELRSRILNAIDCCDLDG